MSGRRTIRGLLYIQHPKWPHVWLPDLSHCPDPVTDEHLAAAASRCNAALERWQRARVHATLLWPHVIVDWNPARRRLERARENRRRRFCAEAKAQMDAARHRHHELLCAQTRQQDRERGAR